MIRERTNGSFEIRIDHPLVNRNAQYTRYLTATTRDQAEEFQVRVLALLDRGIIPDSLIKADEHQRKVRQASWTIAKCIEQYKANANPKHSDVKLLDTIARSLGSVQTRTLDKAWAQQWILNLKRVDNLSPTTIRHRKGALSRCLGWITRNESSVLSVNPLDLLEINFSEYTDADIDIVAKHGGKLKKEVVRDRRLGDGEEARILHVIDTEYSDAERVVFLIALETAMRLREIYTLVTKQVSIKTSTINLDKTKNGDSRQVPLTAAAKKSLIDYMAKQKPAIDKREGRLFPYWSGIHDLRGVPDKDELNRTTSRVSQIFAEIFSKANCSDLRFHDTRHEATCRLFLYTPLDSFQIAKVTGHKDPRMLLRYLSLRGSDLAARLPASLSDEDAAGRG